MPDYRTENREFALGSIVTYQAATRVVLEAVKRASGAEPPSIPGGPKDRFRRSLMMLEAAYAAGQLNGTTPRRLVQNLLPDSDGTRMLIDDSYEGDKLNFAPDVDDVSPNKFKEVARSCALELLGDADVADIDLDRLLRAVADKLQVDLSWGRRINIGENRHFPRMFQWLREVDEETAEDDQRGFHIMNRGGGGRVARHPDGPRDLKVRVSREFL